MEYVRHCDDRATVSTLLGSIAAIGIFNLRSRTRQVMNFANAIPMMNADIITGVSLFLLFVSFGVSQGFTNGRAGAYHVLHALCGAECHATPEKDEPECL